MYQSNDRGAGGGEVNVANSSMIWIWATTDVGIHHT
jgi:hypothetical protein